MDASVPWYLCPVVVCVWLQTPPELSFPVCFDPCSPPPHQTMATCNLCQIWHVDSVMVNCCQTNPKHHMQKAHPQASHQKNRKHYKTKRTSSSSAIKQKTGLHFNKRFYKQKTLLSLTREQLSSKKICGAIKNKIASQSNYHSLLLWDQDQMLKTMK